MSIESPRASEDKDYEILLGKIFSDVGRNGLRETGTFPFSVAENFNIFIGLTSHEMISEKWGVDLDKTLTEGYITTLKGDNPTFSFKTYRYQPIPGFQGTASDLRMLQRAVEKKLSEYVIYNTNV